ncbi:MAG TPA: Hsp20/alpha crystallin family protein [Bryobacteraceae bacterium]|jgi:HSP20 family protein|nr:Hsp20/alpha crystallin family protein [Bryobacteraceae bacterium]
MFDTMLSRDIQQTLEHFRRTMDQALSEFFAPSGLRGSTTDGTEWTFTPTVETGWNDDSLNLRVALPGVTEDNLKVNLQGNQLVVEGERKEPENFAKNGGSLRLPYGRFYRAIDLPNGLDRDRIQCRLQDGVLDIQLPIVEAMKPRRIPIKGFESRKAIAA